MLFVAYVIYRPCYVLSYAPRTLGVGVVAVVCVRTVPSLRVCFHTSVGVETYDGQTYSLTTVGNNG